MENNVAFRLRRLRLVRFIVQIRLGTHVDVRIPTNCE